MFLWFQYIIASLYQTFNKRGIAVLAKLFTVKLLSEHVFFLLYRNRLTLSGNVS